MHLQGLVDAYVANSQQGKAVDYLNGLRDKLVATVATSASSSEQGAVTAAAMPGSSDEPGAASSSNSDVSVDPVGIQLLLGK